MLMQAAGIKNPAEDLKVLGITGTAHIHYQLGPNELAAQAVSRSQGERNDTGALSVHTGEFTGRSPKDRFFVKDAITASTINWNDINLPIEEKYFDNLYRRITAYFRGKEVWVREGYVCADPHYRLNIRVINETPWANLFCYNMFLRPKEEEIDHFAPDWTIIQAPGCFSDPAADGTRQHNFILIHFSRRIVLIGGTAYTGEIKKGIFSVLNYVLPHDKGVLSMHCSANMGSRGDTAIFFGLSGTGKTTLSADPRRKLIGDDEHGWTDRNVFNFEGGCYAKCFGLNAEKEPQIYHAVRDGALLENTRFYPGTNRINFMDKSITENTRVSYPLFYIDNALDPAMGNTPNNIFFLTCDACGVLPPIARLTCGQAMYQFISGYTAKVAGTETGITEPKSTFSACFGAPFLPLHPTVYAEMLGEKMNQHRVNCWLVNTGWTGGPYGTGNRIKLTYTRAMVAAALEGKLDEVDYELHGIFGVAMPLTCPGVPPGVLNPEKTWADPAAYDTKAKELAAAFIKNFEKFSAMASPAILAGAPKI